MFKPYQARDSGLKLDYVLEKNSKFCAAIQKNFDIRVNDLGYYRKALEKLKGISRCSIRSMRSFMDPAEKDEIVVGLRHDVDHDIVTARAMSVLEREFGLSGSYYLLHSAPFVTPYYYADYDETTGALLRRACLSDIYLEMQANGSEIGLHVDPAQFYINGIDGMEAVRAELAWLRGQGLDATGIAAHGSAPFYSCENFEFFREYHLGHFKSVRFGDADVELGMVSAADWGIKYEANYAAAMPTSGNLGQWLKIAADPDTATHLFWQLHENAYLQWGADTTCWLYREDCWAISERGGAWLPAGTLDDALAATARSRGKRVLWHIHPFYLGKRE